MSKNTLADWDRFLGEQMLWLHQQGMDGQFLADPDPALEKQRAMSTLVSAKLNRIVREFARAWAWPEMDTEDRHYLCARVSMAQGILGQLQGPNAKALAKTLPRRPDPDNRASFVVWLLVDVWKVVGSYFFVGLAKTTHAKPPAA